MEICRNPSDPNTQSGWQNRRNLESLGLFSLVREPVSTYQKLAHTRLGRRDSPTSTSSPTNTSAYKVSTHCLPNGMNGTIQETRIQLTVLLLLPSSLSERIGSLRDTLLGVGLLPT